MSELEHYINKDESLPSLIKAGLAHVQFETIHPFLDGNGRIGRMLIMLILINEGILYSPVIYPSYYFKKNQNEYYQKLDSVRVNGDFEGWIKFYLQSIYSSCIDSYSRSKDIAQLNERLTDIILQSDVSSKTKEQAISILFILFEVPIISTQELAKRFDKSYNWASNMINFFININILKEIEDKKRNRIFKFSEYLSLLDFEYK